MMDHIFCVRKEEYEKLKDNPDLNAYIYFDPNAHCSDCLAYVTDTTGYGSEQPTPPDEPYYVYAAHRKTKLGDSWSLNSLAKLPTRKLNTDLAIIPAMVLRCGSKQFEEGEIILSDTDLPG